MFDSLKNLFIKKAKTNLELLEKMTFGKDTAENEDNLADYFLETRIWSQIKQQEKYLILGSKGAGKSALYRMLQNEEQILKKNNIFLIGAVQVRGEAAFSKLAHQKEVQRAFLDEEDMKNLWKLYFIQLITDKLIEEKKVNHEIQKIINILISNHLSSQNKKTSLEDKIYNAFKFIDAIKDFELSVAPNPISVIQGAIKISFRDTQNNDEILSIDHLFRTINQYLLTQKKTVLISIDRLDASFQDNTELEKNALRSLLKVLLDFTSYENIKLIIFLRADIWKLITKDGFRELTHIDYEEIIWTKDNLYQLLIKRLSDNKELLKTYKINKKTLLEDKKIQEKIFLKLFPLKVNQGEKESKTFDWMISRLKDGTEHIQPRDLIFFSNTLIKESIDKLNNIGSSNEISDESIFKKDVFIKALKKVADKRLESNLYAEYPHLTNYIKSFSKQKAEHTLETLLKLWKTDKEGATNIAEELTNIGFFNEKDEKFVIPYLYRNSSLEIKNGKQSPLLTSN